MLESMRTHSLAGKQYNVAFMRSKPGFVCALPPFSQSEEICVLAIHFCCDCSLNGVCVYIQRHRHNCPPSLTLQNAQPCSNTGFTATQLSESQVPTLPTLPV